MKLGKRRKKRRTTILKREILTLEKHLGEMLDSKISVSKSYQHTASYIKDMIQQKRKEIMEFSNTSN